MGSKVAPLQAEGLISRGESTKLTNTGHRIGVAWK
jgi:hypothetical protein